MRKCFAKVNPGSHVTEVAGKYEICQSFNGKAFTAMQVLVIIAGDQLNHSEHDYWCIDKSHKISLRYRCIILVNGHFFRLCWLDWHEKLGTNLIKVHNVTSGTGLSKTMIRCFYYPLI